MKKPFIPTFIYDTKEVADNFDVDTSTVTRWAKSRRLIPVPGTQRPYKFLGERCIEFAYGNPDLIQRHQRRAA